MQLIIINTNIIIITFIFLLLFLNWFCIYMYNFVTITIFQVSVYHINYLSLKFCLLHVDEFLKQSDVISKLPYTFASLFISKFNS